jgi:hypothetical protein
MTEAQEKMLKDLDKKVDNIIDTLGGNKLGTKGLATDFHELHDEFNQHVRDNEKHFANLYKYKNYATGALSIVGVIWSLVTAYIIKLLIS